MKIKVSAQDIKDGVKDDPFCCPIALAANRTHGLILPGVNDTYLWHRQVLDNDLPIYHHLPQEAKNFVDWFDRGLKVDPFEFEIDCKCRRIKDE